MLNLTTLAALATAGGAHFQTPTGAHLGLLISTEAKHLISNAAQPLRHPAGSHFAFDTGLRLLISLAPTDAIVVALSVGGRPIPRPIPCAILTGPTPPAGALRLPAGAPVAFEDLIVELLNTPAPNEPQPAEWTPEANDALGDGPAASNILTVATILAIARDRFAPVVTVDDISLAAALAVTPD